MSSWWQLRDQLRASRQALADQDQDGIATVGDLVALYTLVEALADKTSDATDPRRFSQ